ncbi:MULTISPECIES: hypothetical protein [Marinobacter]|uniref:TraL protein n=1 Tax=Marinobacter sp. MMG032 TaxID=3158548 RepID=A0AAU7MT89_9GAMM|nr:MULTISPECIES: hypothetical protein [Marinobacter]MBY5939004.1 hypothetical protein [Marinobacter nauticus]MBY5956298.1 hypothetical protein [Marinobacter nauticus]MBY6010089.1 hypothetical protein [Marinobacter nauticus]ROQ49268.1 TraL protein [Marinobacter sp. 3-2]
MDQSRLPIYLHQPLQVLWFDAHEMAIIVIFYLGATIFGGVAYITLFLGPALLIPMKRRQARGWFGHLAYANGFFELKGYPLPTATKFNE